MTTSNILKINETRREVARTIVKTIGDWIERHRLGHNVSLTVYIDKDGIADSYALNAPADHIADIVTISEWVFGDRDDSVEDYENTSLSDDEASALIDIFADPASNWIPDEIDVDGQMTRIEFAD